jgi:hypothetical protein
MLKHIQTALATLLVAGTFTLSASAQMFPPTPEPTPTPGTECQIVEEYEPNDLKSADDFQELGSLSPNCFSVTGDIHTGFGDPDSPDPNMDVDGYFVQLNGVTQFAVTVVDPATSFIFGAWDAQTATPLEVQCQQTTCQVTAQGAAVVFGVAGQEAVPYQLDVKASGGSSNSVSSIEQASPDAVAYDALMDRGENLR